MTSTSREETRKKLRDALADFAYAIRNESTPEPEVTQLADVIMAILFPEEGEQPCGA